MADYRATEADLAALIEVVSEGTTAFIAGDMRRYFALMQHADDFTLMGPTGGETIHGDVVTDERIAEMEAFFKSGEGRLQVDQVYASGDLAVIVGVEHQAGVVGDYALQDWSLRVTLLFRHDGSAWRLAHRHADALVHPITFDQLSELARG